MNPEFEQGLLAQARESGISLDAYLQEIVSKQVRVAAVPAAADGKAVTVPFGILARQAPCTDATSTTMSIGPGVVDANILVYNH